jgi:hypothetical protein
VTSAGGTNSAVAAQTGHFISSRADSANQRLYRNGGLVLSNAVASSGNTTELQYLMAASSNYSDAQISAGSLGQNLTDAEALAFYNALNTFLT